MARTLERKLEQALAGVEREQRALAALEHAPAPLTEHERRALARLARELPKLWAAKSTTDRDRKELLLHPGGNRGRARKGGFEREAGRFRRRHLVPVPDLQSLAALNAMVLAGCKSDLKRRISGRPETVGESFARERLLRALPSSPAQTAEALTPRVDSKALVTIKQNRYSVPVRPAGLRVQARMGTREIELCHAGKLVARHEGVQGRLRVCASLDHYLELLTRKPGTLASSLPLAQERERGGLALLPR